MASRRTLGVIFIFSLSFVIPSTSWVVFNIMGDIGLIFINPICQFVAIMACLSFFIAAISLHKLLVDMRYEINETKGKEKNVRDFHQYIQLLNPPSMNN